MFSGWIGEAELAKMVARVLLALARMRERIALVAGPSSVLLAADEARRISTGLAVCSLLHHARAVAQSASLVRCPERKCLDLFHVCSLCNCGER